MVLYAGLLEDMLVQAKVLYHFPTAAESLGIFTLGLGLCSAMTIRSLSTLQWLCVLCVVLGMSRVIANGRPCPSHVLNKFANKTVLITGASSGLGLETAVIMARSGARVVLLCRDKTRGEKAKQEVIRKAGVASDNVEMMLLDVSSLTDVRRFVTAWGSRKVDILINNAGIMACPLAMTKDGIESQFATNYLGHFLLTTSLLPNLQAGMGRVVNVSSVAGQSLAPANFTQWDCLNDQSKCKRWNRWDFYGISKQAQIIFTSELQRRYGTKGILATAAHPGIVLTEVTREIPGLGRFLFRIVGALLYKSAPQGCQSILFAAGSDRVTPGGFHLDCRVYPQKIPSAAATLWTVSENMVKV